MYEPDTILTLKDQREPTPHPTDKEADPIDFPYNRVRVIGASPVLHPSRGSEWAGAMRQGVILEPLTSFGTNLDEPYGKLQQIYDIESVPEHEIEVQKIVVKTAAQMGPSPEEVFASLAEDSPNEGGRRWMPESQRPSPLGEDPREEVLGPLDSPTTPAPEAPPAPKAPASPLDDVPPVGAEVE